MLDMGSDELTVGRAHPMIDPSSRIDAIERAGKDPEVAVLLLDVVLGHGASGGSGRRRRARSRRPRERRRGASGRSLAVVASVVRNRRRSPGAGAPDRSARVGGRLGAAVQRPGRAGRGVHRRPSPRAGARRVGENGARAVAEASARRRERALLGGEVRVVNVGLERFAADLDALGVPVVHVDWSPPAGGDPHRATLVAELADEAEP